MSFFKVERHVQSFIFRHFGANNDIVFGDDKQNPSPVNMVNFPIN